MAQPHIVYEEDLPFESWEDQARGSVRWRTMFSKDIAPTDTMSGGIAYLDPGGQLAPHRHPQAEVYFILDGELEVTIDGQRHTVKPNTTIFIPGKAEHGTVNVGLKPARLFYCFATDSFSDVTYQFSSPSPEANRKT